jgi:hypothetical protein
MLLEPRRWLASVIERDIAEARVSSLAPMHCDLGEVVAVMSSPTIGGGGVGGGEPPANESKVVVKNSDVGWGESGK